LGGLFWFEGGFVRGVGWNLGDWAVGFGDDWEDIVIEAAGLF
jgi:hypothetical protein